MQKIYPLLLEADALILGSPTYFYDVSAQVKAFIDRCYCFEIFSTDDRSVWMGLNEALGGKYAVVIAVCEQHSEADMGYAPEVMSRSLNALGYRVIGSVKARGAFDKGEVARDERALGEATEAGRRLMRTLELRKEAEGRLRTLFGKTSPSQ